MRDAARSAGALALAAGGLASAFAFASCCALPAILAGAGLGTAWLAPAGELGGRLGAWLATASLPALIGAEWLVARASRQCAPDALCARPAFRITIAGVAVIGAVLLVLGQIYR